MCRSFGNDFFQRQGEVRYARTLELPANRGRVLDRNGLMLASSVVAQSIWAIPEDVDRDDPQLRDLARLLEMPLGSLRKRLSTRRQDLCLDQAPGGRAGGQRLRRWASRASTSARIQAPVP
jgi:cell division protein FtsI/penicillin-binding protein 2